MTKSSYLTAVLFTTGCIQHTDTETRLVDQEPAAIGQIAKKQPIAFKEAKLIVEHNSTAEDTGFQGFVDGEPWKQLDILDQDGVSALSITAKGRLRPVGLTELFFETDEPPNAEVAIDDMLAKLPAGDYRFRGRTVDNITQLGTATLSHVIAAGPVVTQPEDGAELPADRDLVFEWEPVTTSIRGDCAVNVTHYELIVNKLDQPLHPGFGRQKLDLWVPATTTRMRVPHEFLEAGVGYEFEVIAIEAGGAQIGRAHV